MFKLHVHAVILVLLLLVTACAAPVMPADDAAMTDSAHTSTGDKEMADGEMADGEMADGEMADGEMADGEMADKEMADGEMADKEMADGEMADGEMADSEMADSEMADVPAWQSIVLTNAVTGEEFTVADFAGKTIFVEPFATWCGNCRRQLGNVDQVRAQAGDDTVFLALSVETNIGNAALADYAAQTGYGLIFAAMTPEMLQMLAAEYGQTVSNPPATPHFVIGPDGTSSELFTGFANPADVQALLAAVGG